MRNSILTLILLLSVSIAKAQNYEPVITPNGDTLPYEMINGQKVFRLTVDVCEHEIAPKMKINAWCYNGKTPGPTIEAVEGDKVKFLVTNKLPEITAVHWHGLILPNGMDGVTGLTQVGIPQGQTFAYEFELKQNGTYMYHSHGDEMVQIGMGSMGFFIIHPKKKENPYVDKDFAIMLSEWFIEPGAKTPNPNVMTDFNLFTFNSKAFPGTEPLVVKKGDRVRIRFGNVSQDLHPIHIHGLNFKVTQTDGGKINPIAQIPETTVVVAPGQTRTIEFIAEEPGDWAMHCHRRHHPMNAMSHDIANMIGVNQKDGLEKKIQKLIPEFMAMGSNGMHSMMEMGMEGPPNTLMMMGGPGPFGQVGMGGMYTTLKVREEGHLTDEWYQHPKGTVAYPVNDKGEKIELKQETKKMDHSMMDHSKMHHH
jgi:FtsP/CotA-like multicopper oxidase with cupredoxin domain